MYTFSPEYLFTKGIAYAAFFDPATDNLLGYSQYVTDFGMNGTMNDGDIEGGLGNQLIMCIPDTSRLEITANTADAALNNMALAVGATVGGNGIIETVTGIVASGTSLALANAVAPYGGQNGAVAYVLTSSGNDKAAVEAASGTAYQVVNGTIQGFTAVSGNTYCVKYFVRNSSAMELTIPALFAPKVVRAHFAVNCYAKSAGGDGLSGSLVKIRHYYFPYYFFTAGLQGSESQTTPGSVNLSGKALTYEEYLASGVCSDGNRQNYGFIVDEIVGGATENSTAAVDGIYFIGLGDGLTGVVGTGTLPVKYTVNGVLTDISDMSQVTFTTATDSIAEFADEHSNVITLKSVGNTTATASVTNSVTGVTYTDAVNITVVSGS